MQIFSQVSPEGLQGQEAGPLVLDHGKASLAPPSLPSLP